MAEREEELKSLLKKMKDKSAKVSLKLNIQKTRIMASGPITSWETDGETVETVSDFIFLAPKSLQMVTAAIKLEDACSWEEKLWQTLDRILKRRDITLPTRVSLVKAMIFPAVLYGCESWTIKKAECQRTDAFELWVGEDSWEFLGLQGDPTSPFWRKSVLNIRWKDWCWTWNSNNLATCCEELTHWKRPRCWIKLKAGGERINRGWDGWMASQSRWTWFWASSGSWRWTGKPGLLQPMG